MAVYELTLPLDDATVEKLQVGDIIYLNGQVCTARDIAHLKLRELADAGKPLPRLPAPLWPSLDWQGYLHSKSQREHSFRCSLALPLPTLPTSCSGTNSQQKTQCGGTRRPPAHHDPTTSLLRRSSNGRQYYPHSQRPRRPVC